MQNDDESVKLYQYAQSHIDPVIKPLIKAMLAEMPEEPMEFAFKYLKKQRMLQRGGGGGVQFYESFKGSNNQEDDIDYATASIPLFDGFNEDQSFVFKDEDILFSFPKMKEERAIIEESIKDSALFSQLNSKQFRIVVDAMKKKTFVSNENIVTQNEYGEYFYILEKGTCDCFVKPANAKNGEEGILVKQFIGGECFGELALMYNRPRGATVKATSPCTCWCLDRVTFRRTLLTEEGYKQRAFEKFLKRVTLFGNLDRVCIAKIADAVEEKTFKANQQIIRQGDEGEYFYVIVNGRVVSSVMKSLHEKPEFSRIYQEGDVFGERSILLNEPSRESFYAEGTTKCIALDIPAFHRLLEDAKPELLRKLDETNSTNSVKSAEKQAKHANM